MSPADDEEAAPALPRILVDAAFPVGALRRTRLATALYAATLVAVVAVGAREEAVGNLWPNRKAIANMFADDAIGEAKAEGSLSAGAQSRATVCIALLLIAGVVAAFLRAPSLSPSEVLISGRGESGQSHVAAPLNGHRASVHGSGASPRAPSSSSPPRATSSLYTQHLSGPMSRWGRHRRTGADSLAHRREPQRAELRAPPTATSSTSGPEFSASVISSRDEENDVVRGPAQGAPPETSGPIDARALSGVSKAALNYLATTLATLSVFCLVLEVLASMHLDPILHSDQPHTTAVVTAFELVRSGVVDSVLVAVISDMVETRARPGLLSRTAANVLLFWGAQSAFLVAALLLPVVTIPAIGAATMLAKAVVLARTVWPSACRLRFRKHLQATIALLHAEQECNLASPEDLAHWVRLREARHERRAFRKTEITATCAASLLTLSLVFECASILLSPAAVGTSAEDGIAVSQSRAISALALKALVIVLAIVVGTSVAHGQFAGRKLRLAREAAGHRLALRQRVLLRYMAHEVRVPLNAISLALEEIGEVSHDVRRLPARDPPLRQRAHALGTGIRSIVREARHSTSAMRQLLNDVLTAEKMEQGAFEVEMEAFSPLAMAVRTASGFRAAAAEKRIVVRVAFAAGPTGAELQQAFASGAPANGLAGLDRALSQRSTASAMSGGDGAPNPRNRRARGRADDGARMDRVVPKERRAGRSPGRWVGQAAAVDTGEEGSGAAAPSHRAGGDNDGGPVWDRDPYGAGRGTGRDRHGSEAPAEEGGVLTAWQLAHPDPVAAAGLRDPRSPWVETAGVGSGAASLYSTGSAVQSTESASSTGRASIVARDLGGAASVRVVGDENRLAQVVANFLSNALKFSPPSSSVDVFVRVVPVDALALGRWQAAAPPGPRATGSAQASDAHVWLGQPPSLLGAATDDAVAGDGAATAEEATAEEATAGATAPWAPATAAAAAAEAAPPQRAFRAILRVEVRDAGCGVSGEDAGLLFRPFRQIRPGAQQRGGGTGLGLSICRSIIAAHGGRVGAHSAGEGRGSVFWFDVPCAVSGGAPPGRQDPSGGGESGSVGRTPRGTAARSRSRSRSRLPTPFKSPLPNSSRWLPSGSAASGAAATPTGRAPPPEPPVQRASTAGVAMLAGELVDDPGNSESTLPCTGGSSGRVTRGTAAGLDAGPYSVCAPGSRSERGYSTGDSRAASSPLDSRDRVEVMESQHAASLLASGDEGRPSTLLPLPQQTLPRLSGGGDRRAAGHRQQQGAHPTETPAPRTPDLQSPPQLPPVLSPAYRAHRDSEGVARTERVVVPEERERQSPSASGRGSRVGGTHIEEGGIWSGALASSPGSREAAAAANGHGSGSSAPLGISSERTNLVQGSGSARAGSHVRRAPGAAPEEPAPPAEVVRGSVGDLPPTQRLQPLLGRTVLLAEDSDSTRAFTARLLGRLGAERVLQAGNGVAALRIVEDALPHGALSVLLLDQNMPGGVQGEGVASGAKALGFNGAVVLVTGDEDMRDAPPNDIDAVLIKPLSARSLAKCLARVLGAQ